jgi:uncharacterized protein YjbJ (UPF0337 family)
MAGECGWSRRPGAGSTFYFTQMNSSTKDKIQGKFHEVKGKVRQKAGQAAGNPDVESKGQSENIAGKVQKKIGQIEKVFEK